MIKIEPIPWIPFLAEDYLSSLLLEGMSVFEYGGGGSTLYFATRVAELVSVEHELEWYHKIKPLIAGDNVTYRLVEPESPAIGRDKSNPDHYTSGPLAASFLRYVCTLNYHFNEFDIIFIDGRSRASCLAHAAPLVKPGGWIILDNSEREYYLQNTRHLFEGWETVEFFGYGPYLAWPWKTLFMRRPIEAIQAG